MDIKLSQTVFLTSEFLTTKAAVIKNELKYLPLSESTRAKTRCITPNMVQ